MAVVKTATGLLYVVMLFSSGAFGAKMTKPVSIELKSGDLVIVDVRDFETASVVEDPVTHKWAVAIHLLPDASKRFQKFTRNHIGQSLSIIVDGKVLASPEIRAEIANGNVQLQGEYTKKQADALVQRIKNANIQQH